MISIKKDLGEDYNLWVSIYKTIGSAISLVDRSNFTNCPINYAILKDSQFPFELYTSESYESIVNERCAELLNLKQPLRILWSGGIDSTLILSSFLKNYDVSFLKNHIQVIMTYESIVENPTFYKKFVAPNFNIIGGEILPYLISDNNGPVITGEHNDQLFGSDILRSFLALMGKETLNKKLSKDIIKDYYSIRGLNDKEFEYWYENIVKSAESVNIKLEVCSDFFWWFNFCFKWQSILLRIHTMTPKLLAHNLKNTINNVIHFYCTKKFQQWSVSNPNFRHFDKINRYKFHAKELIYNLDKDNNYLLNKLKNPSLHNMLTGRHIYQGIDENYCLIKNIEIENYLK